jgi:HK97 family phage portal protein
MGLWQKIKTTIANLTTRSDPQQVRYLLAPVHHAGVHVDHDTALKFSAVFRAVSFISQTIGFLPWMVIRERGENKTRLFNHQIAKLLHQRPNPEMNAISFRETMIAWALTWGNGYAEIERDPGGRPAALWPLSPDRVEVRRDRETNEIYYEVNNYYGGSSFVDPANMYHLHGLGFDGLVGYSVISLAARSIGLSIAAETYGEDFFANGLVTNMALSHPGQLSKPAQDRLKESITETNVGRGKRFKTLVLEEGMKPIPLSIPPEDAQMLQTRDFQVSDIARWFGLPPHKLAQLVKTSYASIEMQSMEVVNDALMPWVARLEQEANYKLFKGTEQGLYTKLNLTSLLRGDNKSRGEYYTAMRNIGVYSTNDIRKLEDMDPVGSEGDALIVQVNMTTLERLVEGPELPPSSPADIPPAPKPGIEQARASYLMLFEDAERRILGREIGQFNQVLHKFQDKSENFSEWADRFFAKHREYMDQTLFPLVQSLAMLMAPRGRINGNLSSVLTTFIESHVETSIQVFSELRNFTETEANDRAKQAAQNLIEQVLICVAFMEVPDEMVRN